MWLLIQTIIQNIKIFFKLKLLNSYTDELQALRFSLFLETNVKAELILVLN
jgi:hypothetical protein